MAKKYVIGIDEVGRGCLAGPVVVAALGVRKRSVFPAGIGELRDSKKMTAGQRVKWADFIKREAKEGRVIAVVASVSAERIDKINVSRAANEAAYRAFKKVVFLSGDIASVTLDGGLYLKNKRFQTAARISPTGFSAKTVVRADGNRREVMLASVFAKVFRDRKMARLDRKFPGYGFADHKGYGTWAHIAAIKTLGILPKIHRETFLKAILAEGDEPLQRNVG